MALQTTVTRGAKILATLGPATMQRETIDRLVASGMDAARLNFSHGTHEDLAVLVALVRQAQQTVGRPLAIVGDLQGPKIRTGPLPQPQLLQSGERVCIHTAGDQPAGVSTGQFHIQTDYAGLPNDVQPGQSLYLKDGLIELEVDTVDTSGPDPHVDAVVRAGGTLTSRAGMNVPGARLDLPALTDKDRADLRFAVAQEMDYLALSFVRDADDVRAARRLLDDLGSDIPLIAKIENALALEHLDAIVLAADGVMVARGDLGVEVGPENVPVWQRRIIRAAADALVPCIVATQMLESMVHAARPTRAEASDVANAVWEGTDAVMLSAETAVGERPVETVTMMERIIRRAEEVDETRLAPISDTEWWRDPSRSVSWAVRSIVQLNDRLRGVVAFTISGYTGRLIAKDRMGVPVLVLAPDRAVEQRAALLWGVTPVRCAAPADMDEMLRVVDDVARDVLHCRDADQVVIVGGIPLGMGKPTNFLKLHAVGEDPGAPP